MNLYKYKHNEDTRVMADNDQLAAYTDAGLVTT